MIEALKKERTNDQQINALISKDAPFELMNELYGMASREYAARRRHLPSNLGQGRPKLPEKELEFKLYEHWRNLVDESDSAELLATDWLSLHDVTQVSLRAMWNLVSRWRREEGRNG